MCFCPYSYILHTLTVNVDFSMQLPIQKSMTLMHSYVNITIKRHGSPPLISEKKSTELQGPNIVGFVFIASLFLR